MLIYIKLLLTSIFWAGTFIAGRVLGREDGAVSPFCAAFLRFLFASVPLVIVTRLREKKLPGLKRNEIAPVVLLALSGVFLYHFLFLTGLETIASSRASLIIATCPVFITLFSAFLFKEKLTTVKLAGIVLSVFGAVFVITEGKIADIFTKGFGKGELCIFGCVICWTIYSLVGKAMIHRLSSLVMVTYSVLLGTIMLFVPAVFGDLFADISRYTFSKDWSAIIYLAVFGTVISYVWYYDGLKKVGPVRTCQFINFIPVFTVIIAFLILNEKITISLIIGAVLVLTGVFLTNTKINFSKKGCGL